MARQTKDQQIAELKEQLASCRELVETLNREKNELMNLQENEFLKSPTYLQMADRISFLEDRLRLAESNYQKLKSDNLKLKESASTAAKPKHNARGAGRKPMDDAMKHQIEQFAELVDSGQSRTQIMTELGISQATYYRYKKLSKVN